MKAGKFLKYLVLTVVAINVAIIAAMFLGSASQPKPVPIPNPNGYDDFVRAGKAVNGSFRYTNQTRDELAKIVAGNSEALKWLHAGVTKECRVPDNYSTDPLLQPQMFGDLTSLKSLAYLVLTEGRLAEMDGRTNDAVKIYLDGIRFADRSGRGGLMIHKLLSIACEIIATQALQSCETSLDSKQCAEVAKVLEEVDAQAEPVETVLGNEEAFGRKYGGVQGQLAKLIMYKTYSAQRKTFTAKIQANILRRRQVMISFATRAYELEKGKPPASIADLAPAYLKAIPQDPVTKTNLALNP
jgi:hypothetical protein